MTTNRTPRAPPPRPVITPEAIRLFRRLQRLEWRCSCPAKKDWAHWQTCPACERAEQAYSELHDALGLPPWIYEPGEPAALWRALEASCRAATRQPRQGG
jgi:hypothetical protein